MPKLQTFIFTYTSEAILHDSQIYAQCVLTRDSCNSLLSSNSRRRFRRLAESALIHIRHNSPSKNVSQMPEHGVPERSEANIGYNTIQTT